MLNFYRVEITYSGILVGYRHYHNGQFIGYTWIDDNYAYYGMFIAKRKLC